MSFEILEKDNIVILKIGGSFDRHITVNLKNKIDEFIQNNRINFLFNLESADFIDSAGLGIMVSVSKILKKKGGIVKICSITTNVKNLFELTRLNQYFEIFPTEKEALESFK